MGRTINAMQGKRVRDLIEPLVTTTPEGAPEYVSTAGRTLKRQGGVTLLTSETQRVVASVMDGEEAYKVELTSTTEGLLASCSCTIGHTGHLCPHAFATAFVVWEQAPGS